LNIKKLQENIDDLNEVIIDLQTQVIIYSLTFIMFCRLIFIQCYLKKKDLINELKNKNLNINEMCSEILENKELIHELNEKNSKSLCLKIDV